VIERGLAHELEGAVHLDYRPEGLVCTMEPHVDLHSHSLRQRKAGEEKSPDLD
jgi:hypothetical protein